MGKEDKDYITTFNESLFPYKETEKILHPQAEVQYYGEMCV